MAKRGPGRKRVLIATLSLLAAGVAVAAVLRAGPGIVTSAALRDARGICRMVEGERAANAGPIFEFKLDFNIFSKPPPDSFQERTTAFTRYEGFFRRGWFDREVLLRSVPLEGFTPEALPGFLVLWSYLRAHGRKLEIDADDKGVLLEEILQWIRIVFPSERAKELLVNLLIGEYEPFRGKPESGAGLKYFLLAGVTARDPDEHHWNRGRGTGEIQRFYRSVVQGIGLEEWNALLCDSRHPREKVRAASLLLLCHHPRRQVLLERAREALGDPSPLVRVAAASALASRRDPAGQDLLIGGLEHERWEIRWWCGKLLIFLGETRGRDAVERRLLMREPDRWVREEMRRMLQAFERQQLRTRT